MLYFCLDAVLFTYHKVHDFVCVILPEILRHVSRDDGTDGAVLCFVEEIE
jgi:hypothetical protein